MSAGQALSDRMREANATFLEELAELEAMVGSMTAVSARAAGRRLRALRHTTAEHFALEEQNGYLSPLLACRPELETKRRGLLDDHRALLQSLDTLVRDADAGEGLTADLRDRLAHWIRDARQHEEQENEFFDEAREDEPC